MDISRFTAEARCAVISKSKKNDSPFSVVITYSVSDWVLFKITVYIYIYIHMYNISSVIYRPYQVSLLVFYMFEPILNKTLYLFGKSFAN